MVNLTEQQKELLENNAVALCTVDENNNPHCIAVGFVKTFSDKILVTDNYMAKTRNNIARNPHVALAVWNKSWADECYGYEFTGTAEYFSKGRWYDEVKRIPENKEEPCKGAILITVTNVKNLG